MPRSAEIHGAQTNEKRKTNKPSSVGSNHTQRAKHVPASDQANQRGSCRCRGATRCSTGSSMSGTGLEPARAPHTTPRRTTHSALPAHQSGSAVLSGARLSQSAASAAATAVFVQNRTERARTRCVRVGTVALRFVEPTSAPETLFQTAVASYHKIREDKAVSTLPCPALPPGSPPACPVRPFAYLCPPAHALASRISARTHARARNTHASARRRRPSLLLGRMHARPSARAHTSLPSLPDGRAHLVCAKADAPTTRRASDSACEASCVRSPHALMASCATIIRAVRGSAAASAAAAGGMPLGGMPFIHSAADRPTRSGRANCSLTRRSRRFGDRRSSRGR